MVLLGCSSMLVACNYTDTAKGQDLCTRYSKLADSVHTLLAEDPLTVKAARIQLASQEAQRRLDDFQAVSEGRFDTALSTVSDDVAAVKESAVSAGTEALDVARPQMKDAMKDLTEAWAVVQDLADTECGAGT
jgi:hypothetical protein